MFSGLGLGLGWDGLDWVWDNGGGSIPRVGIGESGKLGNLCVKKISSFQIYGDGNDGGVSKGENKEVFFLKKKGEMVSY